MSSNQRPYGLTRVAIETLGTPLVASTATTVATVANTLTAGQRVVVTAAGGGSLSLLTTYYVIATGLDNTKFSVSTTYGGVAASMGSGTGTTFVPIVETDLEWPNKVALKIDSKEISWEGGDAIEKLPITQGMSIELDTDCIPYSAHRTIFGKATMTALPGGYTDGTGFGGGNDAGGVGCGIIVEGHAIKTVAGVKTTVTRRRWFPSAVLTLAKLGGEKTGDKQDSWGYAALISKTTTDLAGVTIANLASGGDYFVDMF